MKKIIFVALSFTLLLIQNVKASHIAGAELTYNYLGNNKYQINLKLYWDCTNGFDPGDPQTVNLASTCGQNFSLTVNQTNPGGTDISQLCPSVSSSCNGGTARGYNMNEYSDTITLPPCDTWTMSWSNCCRNAAITNLQTPDNFGMYVQATLNSVTSPTDNSPYFTSQPLPFLCVNQAICYNYGVVEQDGDSLYYSLVNALDAGATTLAYNAGYSAAAPIAGITINPNTGQISFTPTSVGNYVVVAQVAEYTHSGQLIGTVMRDIQFVVFNCNNQTVACTDGGIGSLTGTGVQTGPYSIEMCEGADFTFTITYTDPNAGDSLTLLSNISTVLPGATFTSSGANPKMATIHWVAPAGSANTNTSFSVTVKDNACPVPGQQTFVYVIHVLPRTLAGPDKIICGNQSATLHGTGGSTFNWNVISGPPMVVGTNFSCNPCANPVAKPTSTTTYELVSNLSGTCVNRDTVTVNVVPNYTFITTLSTDTLCLQQLVTMTITPSPAGVYSYVWSPATYLNHDSIANPTAAVTVAGTYNYYAAITSPFGCVKQDTATVTILPYIRTRVGADTILCNSQSTPLHATGGTVFSWSVISGPAMVIGTNFSCSTCTNPIATPTATTTYMVTSNLTGTCINRDTITITVVPNFTNTITQAETITCLQQPPIQLNVTSSPAAAYSYSWASGVALNNYSIPNPLASTNVSGVHVYVVTVASPNGCVKKDSATITITPSFPPNPVIHTSDSIICLGDTVHMGVTFFVPATCGTTTIGCTSSLITQIGTGTQTNTSTTWPAPYGNWYTSAKHQFLFRASELIAAGIHGGKISQIDFNIDSIIGTNTYHQFTINMGCTNVTALSNWVGGLSNVYTPKTYNLVTGWNGHPFDNTYQWDGISNLVVEICFTEGPGTFGYANFTQSSLTPYTTTSFTSCLFNFGDSGPMCPDQTTPQTTNNRPNVKFHYCGGAPDSTRYTYNWFPAANVFTPHAQNTGAIISGVSNYSLVITDTVSGCLDTAYFHVGALTPTALHVNAGSDVTICPGTSTTLTATGATTYSWTPTTSLSTPHTASTVANPSATITYKVTGNGYCSTGPAKDSVTVFVFNGATLAVSAGPDAAVCGTTPYDLKAVSTGGFGGNKYVWTITSGSMIDSIHNPNSMNASVTPTENSVNIYQVTVTDTCGNVASDMVTVTVLLECKLNIPNVFTPNGDGNNDVFLVSGAGVKSYSIEIFDRWGKKMFQSTDVKQSWDGKGVDDGTYYYIIKAELLTGKQINEKGFLERLGK
jgi:gliding motility-associated-like protein